MRKIRLIFGKGYGECGLVKDGNIYEVNINSEQGMNDIKFKDSRS